MQRRKLVSPFCLFALGPTLGEICNVVCVDQVRERESLE